MTPDGGGGLEVRRSTPADDAARDAFLAGREGATLFHRAGWRRAVERTFGHAGRDLVALRGGEVVGVLPLVRCRSPFGRASLVSSPYGVYGGPVGVAPEVERALVEAAVGEAERAGARRLELRFRDAPDWSEGLGLVASDLYATFVRELPDEVDEVRRRMPKRQRAEVRKAEEQHGLELVQGAEHLPLLAELFHASKKELGSPALPLAWFRALVEELPGAVEVHAVRGGGALHAVGMTFQHGATLEFYYIGTRAGANREVKATPFFVTRLQELAVERGLRVFDLGRSRRDSGAYEFKKNQRFEPRPLAYRFRLFGDAQLPSFTPSNPRTKVLRDTWARLPDALTRPLGGWLSRYLP